MITINDVGVLTEDEITRVRKICEDLLTIYEAEKVEVCTNMHLDGSGCDICIEITNSPLYKNLCVHHGTLLSKVHEMREATTEELESVNNYIESISKLTGVSLWDEIEEVRANGSNYDYSTHSYRQGCSYSDRTERNGEE